jgi:hypothetical protein
MLRGPNRLRRLTPDRACRSRVPWHGLEVDLAARAVARGPSSSSPQVTFLNACHHGVLFLDELTELRRAAVQRDGTRAWSSRSFRTPRSSSFSGDNDTDVIRRAQEWHVWARYEVPTGFEPVSPP